MPWILMLVLLVLSGHGQHLLQLLVLIALWGGVCFVIGWILNWRRW